jgi:hypothetical protein
VRVVVRKRDELVFARSGSTRLGFALGNVGANAVKTDGAITKRAHLAQADEDGDGQAFLPRVLRSRSLRQALKHLYAAETIDVDLLDWRARDFFLRATNALATLLAHDPSGLRFDGDSALNEPARMRRDGTIEFRHVAAREPDHVTSLQLLAVTTRASCLSTRDERRARSHHRVEALSRPMPSGKRSPDIAPARPETGANLPQPPRSDGESSSGAKLLRRTEVARLLGVSKSTLRRMEGEQLTPELGPGNVRLFHEEQVQSMIVTRHSRLGTQRSSGDVAADAFALFDSDTHPVDVVKQLRIDPDVAEALHGRWARLRGLLVVLRGARERVREMLCDASESALATEGELVAFVEKWVIEQSPITCHQCRGDWAGFCANCARAWGVREARRQAAEDRGRKL